MANAWTARGRIHVTSSLLKLLDDRELEAVLAHEVSLLGMSRAREFSADAVAATLTGRPSALASALLKLDRKREWVPRSDLRQVDANAVFCIVGTDRSRLGRLSSTHPPTAARVKRLEQTEIRIQAGVMS